MAAPAREPVVAREPILIQSVEPPEIGDLETLLDCPPTQSNALREYLDRTPPVNHQIWWPQRGRIRLVQLPIRMPIARIDVALAVQVPREDLRVFFDGSVLEHRARLGLERPLKAKLMRQEEELRPERPLLHVSVEVRQVRVLIIGLVEGLESVLGAQEGRKLGLACSNVACNRDEIRACHGIASSTVWPACVLCMLRVFSRCLPACGSLVGQVPARPNTAARLHGNVAARARRFAEARGAFEEAVRAVPTAPQNHVLLGNVLFALRSFPEAAAAWKNAISLDAQEPSARLGLARWAIQTGASAKALRELHALPASEQRTVGARCVSALALLARGLPGDAQEALLQARAALEVEPDSHDAAYLEGSSLWPSASSLKPRSPSRHCSGALRLRP